MKSPLRSGSVDNVVSGQLKGIADVPPYQRAHRHRCRHSGGVPGEFAADPEPRERHCGRDRGNSCSFHRSLFSAEICRRVLGVPEPGRRSLVYLDLPPWISSNKEIRAIRKFESLFTPLMQARQALKEWRCDYNMVRPHSRIGWLAPAIYAATFSRHQARRCAPQWLRALARGCNHP